MGIFSNNRHFSAKKRGRTECFGKKFRLNSGTLRSVSTKFPVARGRFLNWFGEQV